MLNKEERVITWIFIGMIILALLDPGHPDHIENKAILLQYLTLKINADSSQLLQMEWIVRDISGLIIESGSKPVDLSAGENQSSFTFDTTGWILGMKDLTVSLKSDSLVSSHFSVIAMTGLSVSIDMKERVIDPSDAKVVFNAEIRNEAGLGVTSLTADKLIVSIDGVVLGSINMIELGDGSYNFEYSPSNITEDAHYLSVVCTDNNGRNADNEEDFIVKVDTEAPEIVRAKPSQYQAGVAINSKIVIEFNELIFSGVP